MKRTELYKQLLRRISAICETRPDYERHAKDDLQLGTFFALGKGKDFVSVTKFYFVTEFFDKLLITTTIEPQNIPGENAADHIKAEFEKYLLRIAKLTAVEGYISKYREILDNAPEIAKIELLENQLNSKGLQPVAGATMVLSEPNGDASAKLLSLKRHILVFSPLSNSFVYLKTLKP